MKITARFLNGLLMILHPLIFKVSGDFSSRRIRGTLSGSRYSFDDFVQDNRSRPAFDDRNRTAVLALELVESLFGEQILARIHRQPA